MAYTIVNGSNSSNSINFVGIMQIYAKTLVNPYTGYSVTINELKNVNNAIYDGRDGFDTLFMTDNGDVVTLTDAQGTIMVKNMESFNGYLEDDIIIMADANVILTGGLRYFAGGGNDIVWANAGSDMIYGEEGDDILDGGAGGDFMFGGDGDDYLHGGEGTDNLSGGAGSDTFQFSVDAQWAAGTTLASLGSVIPFAAMIDIGGKNRSYDGYNGDNNGLDVGNPLPGIDTLLMTSGSDAILMVDSSFPYPAGILSRVAFMEVIEGGAGDDVIDVGGVSIGGQTHIATTLNGGQGNDVLGGGFYNDTLNGGADDDILYGAEGDDALNGGTGNDAYYYYLGNGNDTITETSGTDKVVFGPGITLSTIVLQASGADLLVNIGTAVITIKDHFAADFSGRVETFQFDDGSTFDAGSWTPNTDPVAQADSFSGNEDEILSGNVLSNDTDGENDTLSVTPGVIATAQGGMVNLNADGSFTYQGASNFNGIDGFSYTVSDGRGGTASANVTLNIAAVNDAPVAVGESFTVNEDEILTGNLLGNDSDIDGDTLTLVPGTMTSAQGGTVTVNADGTFSYQGASNFNGADSFSYTVTDGNGGTANATVALNVLAVNDAPAAVNDSFSGNEDELITGNVLANDSDADGDVLSVTAGTIASAQGGSVTLNADGTFSYQGAANFNGADSFSYTVTDGNGGTASATVALNVLAANDAPVAFDDSFSGNEDQPVTGNLLSNDIDADGDTLSAVAGTFTSAQGGTVTISADGTFTYQGAANFNGNDSFSYTLRDSAGLTDTANVAIAVAAVNDAPNARLDQFFGLRNGTIEGNLLADNNFGADTDVDGDTLQAQSGTFATIKGGSITIFADGTFSYAPDANFYGYDSFQYTVLDGQGGSSTAEVMLNVELDPTQSIVGTSAGETLVGTEGDDEIFGLGGSDTLIGLGGDDYLEGGASNDTLYGDDTVMTVSVQDKSFADAVIIPELKERVNISNLKPSGVASLGIAEGNLNVSYDATASITFRKGYAGYNNSFGTYAIAEDGSIVNSTLLWANVKTAGIDVTHQIDLPTGAAGGDYGFFIIADGNTVNKSYKNLDITGEGNIQFIYNYGKADARTAKITDDGNKISIVYSDGVTTKVLQGNAYFTTERGDSASINRDGKVHVVSGLRDTNNLNLDIKKADLSDKPQSFTKNGITLDASVGGKLVAVGDKVGIKSSATGGDIISGNEVLTVSFAAADKVTLSLSDIAGGNRAIDFKIYLDGVSSPVSYEHSTNGSSSLMDIVLKGSDFGGLITKVEISSVSNSTAGVETFYLDNVLVDIPGGVDTNQIRIGFEDLYNTGDADYEDVLFDLDINPTQVVDISGGNDYLDGSYGDDTLYGGGGNDILVLGFGSDQLYGGTGADIFAVKLIDGLDYIHDFNAAEGDVINISDVLIGYDPLSDDINAFVRLIQFDGELQLQVNANGEAGAYTPVAVILGGTGGADVASLLASGNLVADHSALS